MRFKEIDEAWGDVASAIGSGLYKATGGKIGSKQAAIERNYISSFSNQLARSARTGGPAFDAEDYLNAYVQQYGWPISPKEQQFLNKYAADATSSNYSSKSLNQIARLMYSLADKYRKIQGGGTYTRPGSPPPPTTGSKGTKTPGPSPTPSSAPTPASPAAPSKAPASPAAPAAGPTTKASTGQRILNALGRVYKEPNGKADLEQIMRDAAYLLSRVDKARYNATLRDLSSGGTFAAGVKGSETTPQDTSGVRPTPKPAEPSASVPKDLNQAMPGYSKAADDLEQKMTGTPLPPGPRGYRPGTRKAGVTDVTPKRK